MPIVICWPIEKGCVTAIPRSEANKVSVLQEFVKIESVLKYDVSKILEKIFNNLESLIKHSCCIFAIKIKEFCIDFRQP